MFKKYLLILSVLFSASSLASYPDKCELLEESTPFVNARGESYQTINSYSCDKKSIEIFILTREEETIEEFDESMEIIPPTYCKVFRKDFMKHLVKDEAKGYYEAGFYFKVENSSGYSGYYYMPASECLGLN